MYGIKEISLRINEGSELHELAIFCANIFITDKIQLAIKLLKDAAERYVLHLEAGQPLLKITGFDFENDKMIFTVELNYLKSEFEEFKALVSQADYGSFIIGGVHNGNFHIHTDDMENFKPFNVSRFVIKPI